MNRFDITPLIKKNSKKMEEFHKTKNALNFIQIRSKHLQNLQQTKKNMNKLLIWSKFMSSNNLIFKINGIDHIFIGGILYPLITLSVPDLYPPLQPNPFQFYCGENFDNINDEQSTFTEEQNQSIDKFFS